MSTEVLTHERSISKDELVVLLKEAVIEANNDEPNALGVILFGSRTHEGIARVDSDVDLIRIQREPKVRTAYALLDPIKKRLTPWGLELLIDFEGTVYLDESNWTRSSLGWDKVKAFMQTRSFNTVLLDRDSIFITVDPEVEQKLRERIKPEQKKWTKAELMGRPA